MISGPLVLHRHSCCDASQPKYPRPACCAQLMLTWLGADDVDICRPELPAEEGTIDILILVQRALPHFERLTTTADPAGGRVHFYLSQGES